METRPDTVTKVYRLPVSSGVHGSGLWRVVELEMEQLIRRDLADFNTRGQRWVAIPRGNIQRRECPLDRVAGTVSFWQTVDFQRVQEV
jgi:hypothetical protein